MIINDLFTEQKPSVAEDASSAYIFIQGDFDGDTASTGPTQGNQRDQQTTPIQFTHGRMSNVRRLSGPPPEGGKTIKQARIPLTLVAGNQKFSTTGVDLQLTVAPNGYVTKGEFGRVIGIAVVKIMQPESVAEDLTRRGFLRGLGAAALAGAAGDALAGTDDKAFAEKVLAAHNAMQNPRYNKEHKDLGLYIVRGMHGAAAENNKRWYEKTAKLLQKYGVKINEGMAEDDDAVAAFLARGGEIQRGKPARPRKGERWQGSAHIGAAGGRGTKGQVSGLAANTGKSGKPVVTAEQGVAENMNDDELAAMAKKVSPNAYISVNGKVMQQPKNTGGPYTAPAQDAAKMQRDLTARFPNIDELVAAAEQRRDPAYNYAEGDAYYRGRDAEQKYQKLKQIQRVIQGLNESLQRTQP